MLTFDESVHIPTFWKGADGGDYFDMDSRRNEWEGVEPLRCRLAMLFYKLRKARKSASASKPAIGLVTRRT